MSDIINSNIQLWRQKSADGTITREEMRQAIEAIRKERVNASAVSTKSRATKTATKERAKPVDSDDLLSELGI